MEWNRVSWTRCLHSIRTALIEQDALSGCGQAVPGDEQREPEREHRPGPSGPRADSAAGPCSTTRGGQWLYAQWQP